MNFVVNLKEIVKMKATINKIAKFLKDEEGLTTVEYAVAGTLIALAVVAAFTQLGNAVNDSITSIGNVISPED
jgi:pilus assembly protein Flp/PilA